MFFTDNFERKNKKIPQLLSPVCTKARSAFKIRPQFAAITWWPEGKTWTLMCLSGHSPKHSCSRISGTTTELSRLFRNLLRTFLSDSPWGVCRPHGTAPPAEHGICRIDGNN
ncbi:hypothetical protein AVEN_50256-1 [Araneus ventricosus]|uniref:Uncharacterized protein n=1 Tax=Araneus ventricosus TaxID=182803 RepID=A0A4Y2E8P6_ARAVE|nr:hypothetical protein AVEN_50256-1 [Araneus ventricosus]